jgi:hypothetical protein
MDQYVIGGSYDKNLKDSNVLVEINEKKTKNTNENKEMCLSSMEANQNKLKKSKLNDEEKNDIISVEDEIYNLSFKAVKL